MNRRNVVIVVACLAVGVAVVGSGAATRAFYSFDALVYFADDPNLYFVHQADGWLIVRDLPIGAVYQRQMDGDVVFGTIEAEVSGTLSVDYADANFHGPVTLYIEGQECNGHFRAKRVNFLEKGSWVLHCTDGSKIHDSFEFVFPVQPSWWAEGEGMILTPRG